MAKKKTTKKSTKKTYKSALKADNSNRSAVQSTTKQTTPTAERRSAATITNFSKSASQNAKNTAKGSTKTEGTFRDATPPSDWGYMSSGARERWAASRGLDVNAINAIYNYQTSKGGNAQQTGNNSNDYADVIANEGSYSTDANKTTQTSAFDKIRQQYQNDMNKLYNAQITYLAGVRDQSIDSARSKYAGLANNAYTAYRQNMAKRKTMASNLGMTGGAVENMRVGDENNYSNSLANVNAGRNTAYTNARNTYSEAENNARTTRDTAIAQNQADLSQAEINYNQTQANADRQYALDKTKVEATNNLAAKQEELTEAIQAYKDAQAYKTAKSVSKSTTAAVNKNKTKTK